MYNAVKNNYIKYNTNTCLRLDLLPQNSIYEYVHYAKTLK